MLWHLNSADHLVPTPSFTGLPPMIKVTSLPLFVTLLFRGMPGVWENRHRLILCWLIVMQALYPGRKTLAELARWMPTEVTVWRLHRLLKASYWNMHMLVTWWAHEALSTLPPPEDGVITLTGDGSDKPKRGKKNPIAQTGRKSQHDPWFFGIRFALLIVSWDVFRLPVALTYSKRLCLRHIGDVTVVLSKTGRNVSPKHTKILVTTLPEVIPRYVVFAYQKRWAVEQTNREQKSDLGMGEQQVSGEEQRIENSFGIAVMA